VTDTLKTEIQSLEETASKLRLHLSKHNTYKDFQKSLLSPIWKLPNETLVEIFTYVCREHVVLGNSEPGGIWDIQCVCMRWHNVMHSTPSMWR
ncbi:hypothetical protein BDQ17DRAFT_1217679, partial [Cyathus striatus]